MKELIKVGYVGLGRRGRDVLYNCFSQMDDVDVVALCDISDDCLQKGVEILEEHGKRKPTLTKNYADILNNKEIDAVVLMVGWDGRAEMAKQAMLAGKYTAVEVGCAESLEICHELVDTYEQTKVPLMMLENCCYGRREMLLMNMVHLGLFGEIVHCTGGYCHYLNDVELFLDHKEDSVSHYRLHHYIHQNRENYPTHELGPISKILGINRGNRMVKLVSVASKSRGLKQYAKDHLGENSKYAQIDYKQGDIIDTIITCENGETIHITLDTTLPRAYYSRNISVRGTKGMSSEERRVVFLEGMEEKIYNNEEEFFEKYDHPLHVEYIAEGVKNGHGGMDWLVCRAFVESVKNGTNTPIDAYDTALWMSIGCLSAESISTGTAVDIPDFTKGKWKDREAPVLGKYCLDYE